MTSETAAKKDIQRLQRAIVDGLEDVKGHDIVVFNTEHLSPLFERVIVASGTSNRQTKALAASVRDAVREAGFDKPRMEGEENGEWIIVDCGAAVAHVMQPVIRQYYRLEDIWGQKPVRLKHGADKPEAPASATAPKRKAAAKKVSAAPVSGKAVARSQAKSASAASAAPAKKRPLVGSKAVSKTGVAAARKTPAAKVPAVERPSARSGQTTQKLVVNAPAAKKTRKPAGKALSRTASKAPNKSAGKPAAKKKA